MLWKYSASIDPLIGPNLERNNSIIYLKKWMCYFILDCEFRSSRLPTWVVNLDTVRKAARLAV